MEFRLLGPLEVGDGSTSLELGGRKQRALLARLLLDATRAVPAEELVDALWGEEPPETAGKMVQLYVSRLRKVLPPGVLRTRPPGYALAVERESLDSHQFERLFAEGRAALAEGDAELAFERLEDALSLWRGPALAEFSEPFARLEGARLEELRLACVEERIEAELALGRHGEVVAELEALVSRQPLRERPRGQLMLALYRSGRHADALSVFRAFRRTLDEELGMEPSPELKELERRILRQDPGLAARRSPVRRAAIPGGYAQPEVHYAKSGDVSVAYQVVGEGAVDLVLVHGWICTFHPGWEDERIAGFYRRLASMGRLILFDKRGTGLSDRVSTDRLPDLETRMDDVRAVMDAAGSGRAVVLGISEGGPLCALFAASYPERTVALVLMGTMARDMWAPDYPLGYTEEQWQKWVEEDAELEWGEPVARRWLETRAPEAARDPERVRWYGSYVVRGASPGADFALSLMNKEIDVRHVLPAIRVPTLALYRAQEVFSKETRYMGERIPGARIVELPGNAHLPWEGDAEGLLDEIERFLGGVEEVDLDRVLATVLFTDLVGSTAKAAELGDRAWRQLLERHHAVIRAQLARFRGREIDTAGDGVFALFDGPSRAVRCACSIVQEVRDLGLEVRAGLHTGEVELAGDKARGIAVHIGARVAAQAGPGEVLVSQTVKDLVPGSGLEFETRDRVELKGVPGDWQLLAAKTPTTVTA